MCVCVCVCVSVYMYVSVCAVQKDVKGSNTISFFTQIQFNNTQKIAYVYKTIKKLRGC